MIKIKDVSLKSLIESNEGLHLSAYIKHHEQIDALKMKLKEVMIDASLHLSKVLTNDELHRFLEPIEILSKDTTTLKALKGNIGIFRTNRSFKILNVPVDVENLCVVADSFHVKPILKSLQSDRSYLLLGVDENTVTLYRGSMGRMNLISKTDSIADHIKNRKELISNWLDEELANNPFLKGHKLYVAGELDFTKVLIKSLRYRPKYRSPIHTEFSHSKLKTITSKIRDLMKSESEKSFEKSMNEYYWAEDKKMTHDNIFKISKAAVQGRIKKLIIADEVNLFGKLCNKTGDLSIHFDERDHEDDDVLDDLAQTVLMAGGEIVIAGSNKMPRNYPVLAILEKRGEEDQAPLLLNYKNILPENTDFRRTV